MALGEKAKTTAEQKKEELKRAAEDKSPMIQDAADIQRLGGLVDNITTNFENTMDKITRHPYEEQEKLLIGFKKVLEEEVNVLNARLNLTRRVAPVESSVTKDMQEVA
jgi:hypothetical protein